MRRNLDRPIGRAPYDSQVSLNAPDGMMAVPDRVAEALWLINHIGRVTVLVEAYMNGSYSDIRLHVLRLPRELELFR